MAYRKKALSAAKRAASKPRKASAAVTSAPLASDEDGVSGALAQRLSQLFTQEAIDSIVRTDLSTTLWSLKQDYERRSEGGNTYGVFDKNRRKDLSILRKHIDAMQIVLRYYSFGVDTVK